jgi:hypothetical protein
VNNDALSATDCTASNYKMIEERIGNNLEGSGRGLFEILSRYLSGGTEEK